MKGPAVLVHRPGAGRVRPRASRQGRHIARALSLRWACDVNEGSSRKSGIPKMPDRRPGSGETADRVCTDEAGRDGERPEDIVRTNSDAGADAAQLDLSCSACRSMEPGAGGVLAGCGLEHCSARSCSAFWRMVS